MNKPALLAPLFLLLLAPPVHAELRLGGQVEFVGTDVTSGTEESMSDAGVGAFAQFRHTLDSDLVVGAHLSFGGSSPNFDFPGGRRIETSAGADLLGLLAFSGDSYIPVIMLGYSSLNVVGPKDNMERKEETLTGWKFAFGAEFEFTEDFILHTLFQFADYGGKMFHGEDVNATQTSLRLGFAFRF